MSVPCPGARPCGATIIVSTPKRRCDQEAPTCPTHPPVIPDDIDEKAEVRAWMRCQ